MADTETIISPAARMPEGVTDPNWKPQEGRVGNLSVPHQIALEKFKDELKRAGIFDEARMDDAMLLRYISQPHSCRP